MKCNNESSKTKMYIKYYKFEGLQGSIRQVYQSNRPYIITMVFEKTDTVQSPRYHEFFYSIYFFDVALQRERAPDAGPMIFG